MIGWLFGYIGYSRAQKMYQLLMLANNAGMLPNGLVTCGKYCMYANKLNVNYIVELYNNAQAYGLIPTDNLYQQVSKAKSNYIKMWVLEIIGLVLVVVAVIASRLAVIASGSGLFTSSIDVNIYFLIVASIIIIALIVTYCGAHYSKKNKKLLEYLVTQCNQCFYPNTRPFNNQTGAVVIPPQSTNNQA